MLKKSLTICAIILLLFFVGCGESNKKEVQTSKKEKTEKINAVATKEEIKKDTLKPFLLTEENAIDFFFNYEKTLKTVSYTHLTLPTKA